MGELPFREGAKAAAEVADVRVVDVARDDVGDGVAVHLAAERIGAGENRVEIGPPRVQEGRDLVLFEVVVVPIFASAAATR